MLAACGVALIAILGGATATYLYDDRATLGARLCAGVCLGTTALGFAGYALAARLGMTAPALLGAVAIVAAPLLLLLRPAIRDAARRDVLPRSRASAARRESAALPA